MSGRFLCCPGGVLGCGMGEIGVREGISRCFGCGVVHFVCCNGESSLWGFISGCCEVDYFFLRMCLFKEKKLVNLGSLHK